MTARRLSRAAQGIMPLLIALAVACQVSVVCAQIDIKDLSDPSLTGEERKQATLVWLDKYLTDSQLMSKEDLAKIRDAVAKMSPSQLERWLEQTRQLGEYVESPQWQDTKRWLKEFLRVQAIYSDKEIQQLRNEILNADPDQMLAIMKRIQAKHESMTWMYQSSQQTRAVELQQRNASVTRQATAASQNRSSSTANVPLFGSGVSTAQKPSKGYRPPGPLINSRDVARATVWREAVGGGGWGY